MIFWEGFGYDVIYWKDFSYNDVIQVFLSNIHLTNMCKTK